MGMVGWESGMTIPLKDERVAVSYINYIIGKPMISDF
jgi:hypothetical protein